MDLSPVSNRLGGWTGIESRDLISQKNTALVGSALDRLHTTCTYTKMSRKCKDGLYCRLLAKNISLLQFKMDKKD